jgi:hypothetical protein
MKLSIPERLLILGMQDIPRAGNILTMRLVSDLLARTQFTEKELDEWDIKIQFVKETGRSNVQWNSEIPSIVEIDYTPGMIKILVETFEKSQDVPMGLLQVYDRMKALMPEEPKKEEKK